MDKIKWCLKQKGGLKLVESSQRLAFGYLKMAEDSLGTMNREKDKNLIFSVSAGYYTTYYSLYGILMKCGVKCEIHSCSIEFAKQFLREYYSQEDFDLIDVAFSARNILQYYVDKSVNKKDVERIWNKAYDFFVKTREILVKLDSRKIKEVRNKLKNEN